MPAVRRRNPRSTASGPMPAPNLSARTGPAKTAAGKVSGQARRAAKKAAKNPRRAGARPRRANKTGKM